MSPMLPTLPPLFLNSLPKAGTYLLNRVLEGLTRYTCAGIRITSTTLEGRDDPAGSILVGVGDPHRKKRSDFIQLIEKVQPAMYIYGHLPFSQATCAVLESRKMRMVVIVRDPRAVVCSLTHFVLSKKDHRLHKHFAALPNMDAQLVLAIKGMDPRPENGFTRLLPIAERFESVVRWRNWSDSTLVLFEDLVGPKGGGSSKAQLSTLKSILRYIGYDLDEQEKVVVSRSISSE